MGKREKGKKLRVKKYESWKELEYWMRRNGVIHGTTILRRNEEKLKLNFKIF